MGKSTISMAIFNSYVKLPEGKFDKFVSQIQRCDSWPDESRKGDSLLFYRILTCPS